MSVSVADMVVQVCRKKHLTNMRASGSDFAVQLTPARQMTLEQWPGGRWFRDRGNGVGHLWGHLQVIKPPVLLELSGPMFMSYPALNHLEVKLEQRPGGTHVDLRHRAIGFIDPAHRKGVSTGWKHLLDRVAEDCSKRAVGQRS